MDVKSQRTFRISRWHFAGTCGMLLFPIALLVVSQVLVGFLWTTLIGVFFLAAFLGSIIREEIQCKLTLGDDRIRFQDSRSRTEIEFKEIEAIAFHQWMGFHRTPQNSLILTLRETAGIGIKAKGFYRHFGFSPEERIVEVNLRWFDMKDIGTVITLLHRVMPGAEVKIGLVDKKLEKPLRTGVERAGGLLEKRQQDQFLTVNVTV